MGRRRASVARSFSIAPPRELSAGELALTRALELLDGAAAIFDVLTSKVPAERKAFDNAKAALEDARSFARKAFTISRAD